jgi:hypothetical protein
VFESVCNYCICHVEQEFVCLCVVAHLKSVGFEVLMAVSTKMAVAHRSDDGGSKDL